MGDLTILYLTLQLTPPAWAAYQQAQVALAAAGAEIISLSRVPMTFGRNVLQDAPPSLSNIQWQMLRGARLATTPYVAIAEDDTLYPPGHFRLRPPPDTVGYNMTLWGLLAWGEPTYYWRNRILNATLIAPRDLLIAALEERFARYPDGLPDRLVGEIGRVGVDQRLGVTKRTPALLWSLEPVVQIAHDAAHDPLSQSHRKRRTAIRAFDIPYWGRAESIQLRFA